MIEERRRSSDRRDTEDRRVVNLKALEGLEDTELQIKKDNSIAVAIFIGFIFGLTIGLVI